MKKASFLERMGAYIIDLWILFLVTSLISTFVLFNHDKVKDLNNESNNLTDMVLSGEINFTTYVSEYAEIFSETDKNNAIYNVVNAILIIGLFVVIPYFNDGKTIGKTIMKIKVIRDDFEYLSLHNLVIRNFITTSLAYMMISLSLLYLIPSVPYFLITVILGIIQVLLVILSVFMVIYRRDRRGLHDVITHTSVVKIK